MKIGYTRAARLVEIMEARLIVGSQDGVKPGEILLRPENVEAFLQGSEKVQGPNKTSMSSWPPRLAEIHGNLQYWQD